MEGFERFGDKLRALRKHHNVTLHWLATQLGYTTHSYISEIESGQKSPTVTFVLKVSYLFNVTTDQLLKDNLDVDIDSSHIREIS